MVSALVMAAAMMLQSQCDHTAERSARLAASASDVLHVRARSGSLRIESRPGLSEVRARGRACASSEELLGALTIEAQRGDGRVRIDVPEVEMDFGLGGRRYARLDLVIEVPENIEAEVEDGSGEIDIRGVGRLRLVDGSGEVYLEDIRGDVDVEDGSGELSVDNVQGHVVIDDDSGELRVTRVTGDVRVDDDSGEIDIRDVTGSVTVDDGSGDIDVDNVGGDFTVIDGGSGDIDYRNVQGRIDIPRRDRR